VLLAKVARAETATVAAKRSLAFMVFLSIKG